MKAGVTITGTDDLLSRIEALKSKETEIERAAVVAGCRVMLAACRSAAPGSIKNEVGMRVNVTDKAVTGKVGLVKFPRKNNTYHGIYLERGTKYIQPRRFIQNALRTSQPAAKQAIRDAVNRKLQEIG